MLMLLHAVAAMNSDYSHDDMLTVACFLCTQADWRFSIVEYYVVVPFLLGVFTSVATVAVSHVSVSLPLCLLEAMASSRRIVSILLLVRKTVFKGLCLSLFSHDVLRCLECDWEFTSEDRVDGV
ncbi:hypothetical protein Tco_0247902 [Tanacetum coccineum]